MIYVIGMHDPIPEFAIEIDTTSRAEGWSRGLSPFIIGPVKLYLSYAAVRMENAWQFCKVYPQHVGADGEPTPAYFEWAERGWASRRAVRYPMGRGAMPKYSYFDGEKMSYVEARRRLYVPFYWNAALVTPAFEQLVATCRAASTTRGCQNQDVYLRCFDGYNYRARGLTLDDVLNDPYEKMGHGFVLAMMLKSIGLE